MDEDPVEILVGMAERGDIDPWNIDIVEVTDRFLAELEKRRELDLRVSGRTLFYAATLLRIKSEYIGIAEADGTQVGEDDLGSDEFSMDFLEYPSLDPIDRLEREIKRRLERRDMREPPVTLYELIKLLKTAEKEERRRRRSPSPEPEREVLAEDIISIAHREDYRMAAMEVMKKLDDFAVNAGGEITLQKLCRGLGWPIPDVYIPLLFLTLEGKVGLSQPDFFGELFIRKVSVTR